MICHHLRKKHLRLCSQKRNRRSGSWWQRRLPLSQVVNPKQSSSVSSLYKLTRCVTAAKFQPQHWFGNSQLRWVFVTTIPWGFHTAFGIHHCTAVCFALGIRYYLSVWLDSSQLLKFFTELIFRLFICHCHAWGFVTASGVRHCFEDLSIRIALGIFPCIMYSILPWGFVTVLEIRHILGGFASALRILHCQ